MSAARAARGRLEDVKDVKKVLTRRQYKGAVQTDDASERT